MASSAIAGNDRIYSAGDCPVCGDSGALLYLKTGPTSFIFFCPLCGIAWPAAEVDRGLDIFHSLYALAPNGVSLPSDLEAESAGRPLVIVPLDEWRSMLDEEVQRAIDNPTAWKAP